MSKVLELVEQVEYCNSDSRCLTLTKIIRLQHEKLKAIEDVNSAVTCLTDGRLTSYADWELRLIARQTLEETNRIAGNEE